jgi:putative transposase
MQNAYIERFNRTFRQDVLDAYIFEDLYQFREITEEWLEDYNHHRPHESLNNLSPLKYQAT